MTCTQSGSVTLEVVGTFSGLPIEMVQEFPAVLGYSVDGKLVTCSKCYMTSTTMNLPGMPTTRILCLSLLIGAHVPHPQVPFFRVAKFAIDGLDEWVGISGFESEVGPENESFHLRYSLPDDIHRRLDRKRRLGVEFSWRAAPTAGPVVVDYTVSQAAQLTVEFSRDVAVESAQEMFSRFVNLLSFAIGSPLSLTKCELSGPSLVEKREEGVEIPHVVNLYHETYPSGIEKPEIEKDSLLFRLSDVKPFLGKFLKAYFDACEIVGDPLDFYFAVLTQRGAFHQQRFLGVIQALEAFHRRTSENETLPQDEHAKRVEMVLASVPERLRDWVKGRLAFSNEPPLRARIRELSSPFHALFWKNRKERERFISYVVDTRNCLTHYSPELRARAVGSQGLPRLQDLLRAIFELSMLKYLGVDEGRLVELARRNTRIRRLLRSK